MVLRPLDRPHHIETLAAIQEGFGKRRARRIEARRSGLS
jgi:hypothetical protein